MKIIDYKVVWAQSNPDINGIVNDLIKDGWQPLGPCMPAGDPNSGTSHDQQTMVKYEEQSK